MKIETEAFALNDYFNKIVAEYKKACKQSISGQAGVNLKEEENLYRRIQEFKAKYHPFIKERKSSFGKFDIVKYVEFRKMSSKGHANNIYMQRESGHSLEQRPGNARRHNAYYGPDASRQMYLPHHGEHEKREPYTQHKVPLENRMYKDEAAPVGFPQNFGLEHPRAVQNTRKTTQDNSESIYTDERICEWRTSEYESKRRRCGSLCTVSTKMSEKELKKIEADIEEINKTTVRDFYNKSDSRKYLSFFVKHREFCEGNTEGELFCGFNFDAADIQNLGLSKEQVHGIYDRCDSALGEAIYFSCLLASSKTNRKLTCDDVAIAFGATHGITIPGFARPVVVEKLPEGVERILEQILRNKCRSKSV